MKDRTSPLAVALETFPKMTSTDSQLIMREAYETTYGIMNHDTGAAKKRPLLLVAYQHAEDPYIGCKLYERMELYNERKILKWFGIPWDRWIDQPHDICEEQLRRAKRWQDEEDKRETEVQRKLAALAAAGQLPPGRPR